MKSELLVFLFLVLSIPCLIGCEIAAESHEPSSKDSHSTGEAHHSHKILVTKPVRQDVISTQPYVCQIRSCQHIDIRSLEGGYLQQVCISEGQAVRKGELMFQILPSLHNARLESETAERNRIQIELQNAMNLSAKGIVSQQEIAMKKADLAKAEAKVSLARAELDFTSIRAPFDGIVDRQRNQLGSLIEEGDVLTTLSDNSIMWVYFNVPESRYLLYKSELDQDSQHADHLKIELKLANGRIFPQPGKIGAIEADFNNTTGNIAFRADFANREGLLRNGQTGTILIHRTMHDVVVIPQRATFEILDKRYAFVVDDEGIVHQRDVTIQSVQDDIFSIEKGLDENDKIIVEGIRQVRDGDRIEYDLRPAEEILTQLKFHAE